MKTYNELRKEKIRGVFISNGIYLETEGVERIIDYGKLENVRLVLQGNVTKWNDFYVRQICENGNPEVIKILLNANFKDWNHGYISSICAFGKPENVRLMIERKDFRLNEICSTLCQNKRTDILKYMLPIPNLELSQRIIDICEYGNIENIKVLSTIKDIDWESDSTWILVVHSKTENINALLDYDLYDKEILDMCEDGELELIEEWKKQNPPTIKAVNNLKEKYISDILDQFNSTVQYIDKLILYYREVLDKSDLVLIAPKPDGDLIMLGGPDSMGTAIDEKGVCLHIEGKNFLIEYIRGAYACFKTDIPHKTFYVIGKNDNTYGEGIIFNLNDIL